MWMNWIFCLLRSDRMPKSHLTHWKDSRIPVRSPEISDSASVSGGVARYAVKIELAKDENMRAGMNASATITIESKEDIITIPLNALQEQGGKTFVYHRRMKRPGS